VRNYTGCIILAVVLIGPGVMTAYAFHSWVWLIAVPFAIILIMCLMAAFGGKRKIAPQQWADELEKHLLGEEGPFDWDNTTSVTMADDRLDRLRPTLIPEYDLLDTPEKRDRFRRIIETLRRGEIPD